MTTSTMTSLDPERTPDFTRSPGLSVVQPSPSPSSLPSMPQPLPDGEEAHSPRTLAQTSPLSQTLTNSHGQSLALAPPRAPPSAHLHPQSIISSANALQPERQTDLQRQPSNRTIRWSTATTVYRPEAKVSSVSAIASSSFASKKKVKLPWHLNTRTFTSHCLFGSYIYLPLLASLIWAACLAAFLYLWIDTGRPRYTSTQADIAYISDVGAAYRVAFASVCIVVAAFYFATVCVTRWLRHKGRIPGTVGLKEKIFSWLAIFWCAVGCAGLIVLACWNCWVYPRIHWYGTFVFITGIALSAAFQTAEVWCLRREHEDRRHLRRNSCVKIAIDALSIILASAFGVSYMKCNGKNFSADGSFTMEECNASSSTAGILEWTIAFGLNGYFLTLVADLWPSAKSSKRYKAAVRRYCESRETLYLEDGEKVDITRSTETVSSVELREQERAEWEDVTVRVSQDLSDKFDSTKTATETEHDGSNSNSHVGQNHRQSAATRISWRTSTAPGPGEHRVPQIAFTEIHSPNERGAAVRSSG